MASHSAYVLKMLKEMAEKEVEIATQALADAMKIADEAQSKYKLLTEYRQEYSNNLNQSLETGLDTQAYQNFHGFFRKLDQAVKGQMEVVELTKHQVQVQKKHWKESQRKKLSYEVLDQRNENKQEKMMQKKDQKLMDEFAMRAAGRHHK